MAAAGYTPISLYYSTTAAAQPVNTNLVDGELAINITDGKLYYKDNTGTVKLIASNASATTTPVTSISVATSNGLAGSSSGGTTPTLTLSTTVTGIVKGNGTSLSAAVSGTDYAPATSGTSILYGDGSGGFSNVTIGTGVSFVAGTLSATGSGGTVTSVSVASANGFTGTSSGGATPALTLATSVTGIIKGNGTAISAATANTDYLVPALANTAVTGFKTATFNSQTTIATTTGAITVDWTTAQNQKQTEPTGTITYTFTAPPGVCHLQLVIDSDGTSTAQTINWPASVIWLGTTWSGTNNKKAVINFWYDGTNYFAIGSNQA